MHAEHDAAPLELSIETRLVEARHPDGKAGVTLRNRDVVHIPMVDGAGVEVGTHLRVPCTGVRLHPLHELSSQPIVAGIVTRGAQARDDCEGFASVAVHDTPTFP
jgi:hypothetical protein